MLPIVGGRVRKLHPFLLASKDESFSRMASWGPFYWKNFLLPPWSGMIQILSWPVWDIAIFNVGSDFPLTLCFGTRVISMIEWPISNSKISLPFRQLFIQMIDPASDKINSHPGFLVGFKGMPYMLWHVTFCLTSCTICTLPFSAIRGCLKELYICFTWSHSRFIHVIM